VSGVDGSVDQRDLLGERGPGRVITCIDYPSSWSNGSWGNVLKPVSGAWCANVREDIGWVNAL